MADFTTYPAYRKTGRDWFPEIPIDWRDSKVRWISTRYAGGTPDKNRNEYWDDGTIPWLNSGAVNQGSITTPSELISEEGFKNSSAKWVPIDGLVMALAGQGKTKGMVAQTKIRATCNQSMAAIVIDDENPRFIYWWLTSQYRKIRGLTSDEGRDGLNLEHVGSIQCPLPSIEEQQTIARFLDFKTAQIDALIAKKKALLDKLAEKRTALISHAVTKGLDPSVPMKDSGVEWLGEIPAHWDAKRLKFLIAEPLKYGANEAAELTDPDLPRYIRITDVNEDGSLRDETFRSLPEEIANQYLLADGDILLARSGATVGKTFIYKPNWGVAAYAGYLIRARMAETMNADFAYQFLQSGCYWQWLNSIFIQATIQNVSAEKYANLVFPVPPLAEQIAIINALKKQLGKIDSQRERVELVLHRLQEYRSALITNAVTGKIDVRGFKIPEPAKVAAV